MGTEPIRLLAGAGAAGVPLEPEPPGATRRPGDGQVTDSSATIALLRNHSLATLVRQELERRILGGEIAPGAKLNEADVADELGVSRGPVREAFRGLEQAGLLRVEKNRGVFVRELSVAEADELYEVRAGLDALVGKITAARITAAQVQQLWDENWHPCLVAAVDADNDYAFATAPLTASPIVVQRNNLAQRNLSVINVLAGARAAFPFLAGHLLNDETTMHLVVNRARLPKGATVRLALDEGNRHFPRVDLNPPEFPAVVFRVTFSEAVTGVDLADFGLTTAIPDAAILEVTGSGTTYDVLVYTGNAVGTLRLDVLDDDSILDAATNPLAGGFTSGEAYNVDPAVFADIFYDGFEGNDN